MKNNNSISELAPELLWKNFAHLNAVPRPSKKEERVIQFAMDYGKKLGLETLRDSIGNVVIKKPATQEMENRKTVILQSHLDMVHQKNNDTTFDFDTQGIKMYIDNDWVKADGTTLGADNGIGIAAIMGILESDDIAHPNIEALFTVDEETGMTGAKELDDHLLEGKILLNLDTEEDDEIVIGCAGGVDLTATKTYAPTAPTQGVPITIDVKGLQGGHSGMDIIKELGNANKIMNRILYHLDTQNLIQIAQINGGSLRNAIPRESVAVVVVNDLIIFKKEFENIVATTKQELEIQEPNLSVTYVTATMPETVISAKEQPALLQTIYSLHNGVFTMSRAVEGLVETSNNISKVTVQEGRIQIECLTRSSVESSKQNLINTLSAPFYLGGFEVSLAADYPGWMPRRDSAILEILSEQYQSLFGDTPNISACHAGLECGLIGEHYPHLDMVSFGPTIKGAHSPDERVCISSVQKFWKLLLSVLSNIPSDL